MNYLTEEKFETKLNQGFVEFGERLEKRFDEHFRFIQEYFRMEFDDIHSQFAAIRETIDKMYVMLDCDAKWRGEHEEDHAVIHKRVDHIEKYLGPGFRKTLST